MVVTVENIIPKRMKTTQKRWSVTIRKTDSEGTVTQTTVLCNSQREIDNIFKTSRAEHEAQLLRLSGLPDLKTLQMALSPHPNYDTRRRHGKILESLKYNRMFPRPLLSLSVQPC